jgi:heme/copper-type cytochrome/quinol oxidase subunit 2
MLKKKYNKVKITILMLMTTIMLLPDIAYGAGIKDSSAAKGTVKLIDDTLSWLIGIALAVGSACTVYFAIRRAAADEVDKKMWDKRIATAVVSTIVATVASALIKIVLSYYK